MTALFFACLLNRKWEEVDHDLENSVAGALSSSGSTDTDGDPLGLGSYVKYVRFPLNWLRTYELFVPVSETWTWNPVSLLIRPLQHR